MKKLLISLVLLVGCVGNPTPHNPMAEPVVNAPWWRATTVGVKLADNPWEAFNQPKVVDTNQLDPWADFEELALFPEGFEPAETAPDFYQAERIRLLIQNTLLMNENRLLIERIVKKKRASKTFDKAY